MAYPVLLHPEVARELYWRIKTRAVRRFATSKLPFRMTFTKSRWVRVPLDRYMCPLLDAGSEDPPPTYLLPQLYHGATLRAISYRTATESVPRIRGTSMPNPAPSILPRGFSTQSDAVVVLAAPRAPEPLQRDEEPAPSNRRRRFLSQVIQHYAGASTWKPWKVGWKLGSGSLAHRDQFGIPLLATPLRRRRGRLHGTR
jgi:hypothetical protein